MNDSAMCMQKTFERIAREELEITTLESRHNDADDFHSLAVWEIVSVMERAYQAGIDAAGGSDADVLAEMLRRTLGPHAIAAIAAYLKPVHTLDGELVGRLRWFRTLLIDLVGGDEPYNRLCVEAGL